MLKIFRQIFLLFGGILLAPAGFAYLNRIPNADVELLRVDRDTTFHVGKANSEDLLGGQLAMQATGQLDDSTAVLLIDYTQPVTEARQFRLPAGTVNTMRAGDFYDKRAKITYRHRGVKKGHLRLQAVFGQTPEEWRYNLKDGQRIQTD